MARTRRRPALILLAAALAAIPACRDRAPDDLWSRAAGPSGRETEAAVRRLVDLLREAVDGGDALAAQLALGDRRGAHVEWAAGWLSHRRARPVTVATRFSIGSVSKPMAAAVVLRLAERGAFGLDEPVDRWLPELADLRLPDGERADRAPTLRELLCHRGGLLSQTRPLTPAQLALLYDWTRPLEAAVRGIAAEPLLHPPGESFAYSAAGYDVAGRVVEVVTGRPFDSVLAEELTTPLGMSATGYRVFGDPPAHATAALVRDDVVGDHPMAPNLAPADAIRVLVGGGLSSTAHDVARFARMVAAGGTLDGVRILGPEAWAEWLGPPPFEQRYGLGWRLVGVDASGRTTRVAHEGAIAGGRAFLRVDLAGGRFAVVLITLANPTVGTAPDALEARIDRRLKAFLDADGPRAPRG